PYYTTSEAVVAVKGTPAAEAKSLEDLKKLKFGVQTGTTSQNYVMNKLKPSTDPLIFNGSADVVQALKGGQVDAIVVDLPTAFNVIATQVENGTVVGQFTANEDGNNFGLLLPKGSALTPAVTKAVDTLRDNGTLAELQKKWLADAASAPIFEQ
ncbi:MAG: transporter substrate-binding domain-containing protein, partial [Trueperella pyogenes]|nr:transporter substrate-binding domain-containing protein [Trueperella pyogenes]